MKIVKTVIIFLLYFNYTGLAQYKGGSNDGFNNVLFPRPNNTDSNSFKAGTNDGNTVSAFTRLNSTNNISFKGSSNDGNALSAFTILKRSDSTAFSGGIKSGSIVSSFTKINKTDTNAARGGIQDGFVIFIVSKVTITDTVIFHGGKGRGEKYALAQKVVCGVPGAACVWNGNINTDWNNPNNWNCANLPGSNSVVIISNTASRFPSLVESAEIKSLQLLPGTSVTVPTGITLKINGQ